MGKDDLAKESGTSEEGGLGTSSTGVTGEALESAATGVAALRRGPRTLGARTALLDIRRVTVGGAGVRATCGVAPSMCWT